MANPNPSYKKPAKFPDANGVAVRSKTVRIAEYLIKDIEDYAQQLHAEKLAKGEVPCGEKSA
jgi:Holliday junction resolvasome RuvABC ATP-dependent DNA helicase subunit